ncbi:hypothetical protein Tco_0879931 [Tanacetum coccineum]
MVKRMMTGTELNIEKFDGKNDFPLWQVRMKALLKQQRLAATLEELPAATIVAYDYAIRKKAFSALILCLVDRVLREITKEMTTEGYGARDCPWYNHKKSQGCVRIEDHVSGSGADRKCRVRGTGKVQVQMEDWPSFVLDNVSDQEDIEGSTQQCTKSGITKHLGVAGIKQQNGLVEKTNVTLLDNNGLKDDMDAQSDVYVLSSGCKKCSREYTPGMFIHLFLYIDDMVFSCGCKAEIWATKGLLDKAKGYVLGMEIVRNQSGSTLRVSQSMFYNGKLVQTLLEGHSILSLEGSLLGDCDVEKNDKWSCIYAVGNQEYQMVCTRLDITSADVVMLDKFDRGLQTDVQVFVDFDYSMGRLITGYG